MKTEDSDNLRFARALFWLILAPIWAISMLVLVVFGNG